MNIVTVSTAQDLLAFVAFALSYTAAESVVLDRLLRAELDVPTPPKPEADVGPDQADMLERARNVTMDATTSDEPRTWAKGSCPVESAPGLLIRTARDPGTRT